MCVREGVKHGCWIIYFDLNIFGFVAWYFSSFLPPNLSYPLICYSSFLPIFLHKPLCLSFSHSLFLRLSPSLYIFLPHSLSLRPSLSVSPLSLCRSRSLSPSVSHAPSLYLLLFLFLWWNKPGVKTLPIESQPQGYTPSPVSHSSPPSGIPEGLGGDDDTRPTLVFPGCRRA